ncbi:nuclear transport factor 2 family protein [Tardiphaga alba]|uniref:Nuclear transport factor 2 family protein n=1 Tax=Tardiphaga alba TaxID=340268 RepID=A0ABX8ACP0_9BRAD|nr:nuclear transport factor 2 family protein [Tardiphaga alba]QUS41032.1 nuclear transport factor 2 family protein [Tardiphaga alba]
MMSISNSRMALIGWTVLAMTALWPHLATASGNADTVRNKQIVSDAFQRWAAGGTTFFTDLLAPEVVWTVEGSGPNAGTHRGRDALMERAVRPLAARLSESIKPVSTRIWADGDHVIVNWDGVARARDGVPYTNRYVWIMRMQDGKAIEVNAFLDLARFDDVLRRVSPQ